MNQDRDCFICLKHREAAGEPGGILFEDALLFIGHAAISDDGKQPLLGHYLVEPKRHVCGIGDLSDAEAGAAGLHITRTSRALQSISGAEHIYIFVLGHHVDHLHIHVVPSYPDTPREYWGVRVDEWPEAPHGSAQDIFDLNNKMRIRLAEEGF